MILILTKKIILFSFFNRHWFVLVLACGEFCSACTVCKEQPTTPLCVNLFLLSVLCNFLIPLPIPGFLSCEKPRISCEKEFQLHSLCHSLFCILYHTPHIPLLDKANKSQDFQSVSSWGFPHALIIRHAYPRTVYFSFGKWGKQNWTVFHLMAVDIYNQFCTIHSAQHLFFTPQPLIVPYIYY